MSDNLIRQLVSKPSVKAVTDYYKPPACGVAFPAPDSSREVVVLATACFQGVDPRVYDSHRVLVAQMAVDYRENLWIIPVHERMTFPDAPIYAIGAMMNMETLTKRKADWFFWVEDDVCIPRNAVRLLKASADPVERPFVAAIGYDRNPPFPPAVWDWEGDSLVQWTEHPCGGLHKVGAVGLTAALFHRSLFDRVKEPFFAAGSPVMSFGNKSNQIQRGIKPDAWWSLRLKEAGIPIYVNAEITTTHLSARMPINRMTGPMLRNLKGFNRDTFERTMRGSLEGFLESGDSGVVPSCVRPSASQGMESGHVACDGVRASVPTGEHSGVGVQQAPTTSRPELSDPVRVIERAELWRDWAPLEECK